MGKERDLAKHTQLNHLDPKLRGDPACRKQLVSLEKDSETPQWTLLRNALGNASYSHCTTHDMQLQFAPPNPGTDGASRALEDTDLLPDVVCKLLLLLSCRTRGKCGVR